MQGYYKGNVQKKHKNAVLFCLASLLQPLKEHTN